MTPGPAAAPPSDRDARFHLLQDHALRSVGYRRCDLDAAIHGTGVHDERVGLREPKPRLREAECSAYARRRKIGAPRASPFGYGGS